MQVAILADVALLATLVPSFLFLSSPAAGLGNGVFDIGLAFPFRVSACDCFPLSTPIPAARITWRRKRGEQGREPGSLPLLHASSGSPPSLRLSPRVPGNLASHVLPLSPSSASGGGAGAVMGNRPARERRDGQDGASMLASRGDKAHSRSYSKLNYIDSIHSFAASQS